MDKNYINSSIELTEASMDMSAGDITWSVGSKRHDDRMYVCLEISLKGREFINIMGQLYTNYKDELNLIDDIMYVERAVMERVPVVLSVYGLSSLIEAVARKGMKMVFVVDIDKDQDYLNDLNVRNMPLN